MAIELVKEKYGGPVNTVAIGPGSGSLKIGGQTMLPFLFAEGDMPNEPAVAMEIFDCEPVDWPQGFKNAYGKAIKDPVQWAVKCVSDFGSKILCVRLQSVHPDWKNASGEAAVSLLEKIRKAVNVPLIVTGSGDDEKDNDVMPMASQALKGSSALLGIASQNNYKTLAATALADGHSIIAESPIDINIAKQLNILISDMGFDPARIVMHPTTASLGYGMEYVYSIMERSRLAAFLGDRMLAMPFILFAGQEVWRTREAREGDETLGVNWEIATSVAMLQAGADILVVRHPTSAKSIGKYIEMAMKR